MQPDLLVVSRADPGDGAVTTPLALAVEVLSPSSPSIDRVLKRELYEQSGDEQYWLVDPDEPSVTVWTREGGTFGQPRTTRGDEWLELAGPLHVTLQPTALVT